jgi:hypothetical protein
MVQPPRLSRTPGYSTAPPSPPPSPPPAWGSRLQDFVGRLESLTLVASIMAAATRLLFRQLALPLPPWREPRVVLSRWVSAEPDAFEDEQVPLLPAPEQVRTRARTRARPLRPGCRKGSG